MKLQEENWSKEKEKFTNFENKTKEDFAAVQATALTMKEAADELGEDFDCALIDPRFTKPIDKAVTEYFAKTADTVVTLEDHVLAGGYGSLVAELLVEKAIHTPLVRVGWPDQFIEHASSVGELREKYGLTSAAVVAQIKGKSLKAATGGSSESAVA